MVGLLNAVAEQFSWRLFVDFCRLISICTFLLCSLTFTWYSFVSLILLLGSLYLMDREKYTEKKSTEFIENPYKGKRRVKDEDKIPADLRQKYIDNILDYVLYDAENCETLSHFEPVKTNTHCTFARMSKLWGALKYNPALSVEANVERSIPAFIKFLTIGSTLHLDGFVFELPGEEFGNDVEKFGQGVRRVLKCISDHDPVRYHCMNKSIVSGIGWSFEFDYVPIFVTTFAPCYSENHSRYAFGAESGFILLQPMYSFAIHDIGKDTPFTNWDDPKTVRDKIRVAYKENGRPYYIRDTLYYPMAHDLVKPLVEGPGNVIEWWKKDGEEEEEEEEDDEEEDEESGDENNTGQEIEDKKTI